MTRNLQDPEHTSSTWPASAPPRDQALPTALEADLAVVAWLETAAHQLSEACTDHILVALLDWSTARAALAGANGAHGWRRL